MIQNLNGDFETVEYTNNGFIMMYDNVEYEDYPVHWHNALEIIMPLVNGFTVTAGGRTWNLREREIIIIPSGELHSMNAPEKGQRIIFQCDSTVLNESPALSALSPMFTNIMVIDSSSPESIRSAAKKAMLEIYDEYFKKNELTEIKIYIMLLSMFAAVHEGMTTEKRDKLGYTNGKLDEYGERFGAVKKYIEKNYMYDISLDKLASIAGYSKYHFSRIFKQYTGSSHIEYVNKARINVAQKLLLDPDISITEVAMNSGFTSITSFNRVFKEVKHCTPSEFKKFYKSSE